MCLRQLAPAYKSLKKSVLSIVRRMLPDMSLFVVQEPITVQGPTKPIGRPTASLKEFRQDRRTANHDVAQTLIAII